MPIVYLVAGARPNFMNDRMGSDPHGTTRMGSPFLLRVNNDFVTMTFVLPDAMVRIKKSSEKSSEKILEQLKGDPTLSAKALAEKLGISARAVEKQIDLLKKEGRLSRIGPAKGGYWKVIK